MISLLRNKINYLTYLYPPFKSIFAITNWSECNIIIQNPTVKKVDVGIIYNIKEYKNINFDVKRRIFVKYCLLY